MKKLLAILVVALFVAVISLPLMTAIPIKDTAKAPCCDQFDLESSYGFPLAFKQVYSGGFSGRGEVVTKPGNVMVDGVIVFAATAAVLSTILLVRKRSRQ